MMTQIAATSFNTISHTLSNWLPEYQFLHMVLEDRAPKQDSKQMQKMFYMFTVQIKSTGIINLKADSEAVIRNRLDALS